MNDPTLGLHHDSLLLKLTVLSNPRPEVHQRRMHLPHSLDVRPIPFTPKPIDHRPQLRADQLQRTAQNRPRRRQRLARHIFERLRGLVDGQLVARQPDRLAVVLAGILKRLRGEDADVATRDPLQRLAGLQRRVQRGEENA